MSEEAETGIVVFLVVAVLALFTAAIVFLVPVLLIWWAWNAVMPFLFGLPHISFWHAVALSLLLGAVNGAVSVLTRRR